MLTPTYGLGDKGLAKGMAEYKGWRDTQPRDVPLDKIIGTLRDTIKT